MPRTSTGTVAFRGTPTRWWARISIRDESGEIHRPWIDLERPDLRNTPEDKATAKRLALKRAKVAAKSKAVYVGKDVATRDTVTLRDLEDKWFAHTDRDAALKPATRARLKASWASFVKVLGGRPVSALTPSVLRAWIQDVRAVKSASSTRNDVNALTRFFKDAIAEKWVSLSANPMRDEHVRDAIPGMKTQDSEDIVSIDRESLEMLLASKLTDRDFGRYLAYVLSGLRDGELHGAQFGDIRTEDGIAYVHVTRQATLARIGEPVKLASPKSKNSKRRVPLHPLLQTWLAWWESEGWEAYVGRAPSDEDALFPSPDGSIWRPRSARTLRGHLAAAGLPVTHKTSDGLEEQITVHALRRSFATMLGGNAVEGEVIDRLLGHTPASTRGRHYQRVSLAPLARAIATLRLALPERSGVRAILTPHDAGKSSTPSSLPREDASPTSSGDEPRPGESSHELSRPLGTPKKRGVEIFNHFSGGEGIRTPGQLAPSAVFKVIAADTAKSDEIPVNQAQSTPATPAAIPTNSDEKCSTVTLENKGGTLWDTTIAALGRALGQATTDEARMAILGELKAWREQK